MLLASSVGHAQNFNYRDLKNYTYYRNSYTVNYNYSNRYSSKRIVKYLPIDGSWSNIWSWNNNNMDTSTKPETSKPEEKPDTEKPNTNVDNKENDKPTDNKENTKPDTNTGTATSIEMEVARLVNIERQKEGLAPLTFSEELSKVARIKSQDMANNNYFSHNSPTYGDPFSMMKSFGIQYKTAGENIAKGYSSAESVVRGWMNSSGHRANILNPSFGKIGVGYVNVNGTTYWTQMFTN
ncbi:MAG: serine protease [Tissierellia bacterium]|nr:serine protease [Tissierellia bacterium]